MTTSVRSPIICIGGKYYSASRIQIRRLAALLNTTLALVALSYYPHPLN